MLVQVARDGDNDRGFPCTACLDVANGESETGQSDRFENPFFKGKTAPNDSDVKENEKRYRDNPEQKYG